MTQPLVLRDDADGVATLTLNRPAKLNAVSAASFVELRAHVEAIAGSPDSVGCVVLTGAGTSFCAGHDLGAITEGDHGPSPHFAAETIDALEQLPQPTIAKIRGHCYTGGLELALGCDLLVAADSARLGDTHGQWGLVPVWGMSVRLPERIGASRAKEMMFTSRRIDASEAAAIGLIDRVVPEADLDAAVARLGAEIVANSWGTNRIDKALLATQQEMGRAAALEHERSLPLGTPTDSSERMAAFAARKKG